MAAPAAAPPAAAPAAPAAPVTAPASSPASAPAAPLEGGEPDAYANAFGELDAMDATDKAPPKRDDKGKFQPRDKTAPKPAEPAKPSDPTPVTDPNKAKAPDAKPADAPANEPTKAKDLRAAYDAKKAQVAELEPLVASLKSKVAELEKAAPADVTQHPDYQAAIKERDALRDEIRFVNYQKHPEFKEKFDEPYKNQWARAIGELTQFTITVKTGSDANGDDITAERPVTADDIVAFAAMPPREMDKALDEAFGPSAKRFVNHIEKLRELATARDEALANARTEAANHEKTTSESNKALTQKLLTSYQQTESELKTKYPTRFGPVEGDADGNALLDKASKYVDDTFSDKSNLPQEERAKRLAAIRLHAKAYPRALKQLATANARIKELEASLAEFEKSGDPGDAGDPGSRGGNGTFLDDAMAEIDSLNKPGL